MNRCYSPLKGFIIPGEVTKNGKPVYKITPYSCDHLESRDGREFEAVYDSFISRASVRQCFDYIEIPCGKCIGCRLRHAETWSIRCLLEAQRYKDNVFLTLTYDPDHLPYSVDEDGVLNGTLKKRDLQLFWKRLRKALPREQHIRYFACGEYGDKTFRPHYHAIVFNFKPPDLEFYRRSPTGDIYYHSKWLDEIWENGAVIVGDVTKETCAYTARYVIKKAQDSSLNELYSDMNIQEEFIVMSRRPGIAADVYLNDVDFDSYDIHHISTDSGSISYTAPRYFRKLGEKLAAAQGDSGYYRDRFAHSVSSDLHQNAVKEVIGNGTDLNYLDYLEMLEGKKQREITALKRDKL